MKTIIAVKTRHIQTIMSSMQNSHTHTFARVYIQRKLHFFCFDLLMPVTINRDKRSSRLTICQVTGGSPDENGLFGPA
jgi:hypothetical protein